MRIAMTVLAPGQPTSSLSGQLATVLSEHETGSGEVEVRLSRRSGLIHADLRLGANVASAQALRANERLSNRGVQLFGAGFIVTPEEAAALVPSPSPVIRAYRNGRDLTDRPRGVKVIDLFGLSLEEVRSCYPAIYQRLVLQVKPERDAKGNTKDGAGYAKLWWLFGKPRQDMRVQLQGLPRYIATPVTAKHRTFQFLDASVLADDALICIAVHDALVLGILSSQIHIDWSLATGSTLEDRPRYIKTTCFETFPFPTPETGLTPAIADRIRGLAEAIDAHRKARQAAHEEVTLTGMYNVLTKLRSGEALTAKEKTLHAQGLVSVLQSLHEDLDAAVLEAYGWSDLGAVPWRDDAQREAWTENLLERLVGLNAQRAASEAAGTIHWLRPALQNPAPIPLQAELIEGFSESGASTSSARTVETGAKPEASPWPTDSKEQLRRIAELLAASPQALTEAQIAARFQGRGPWKKRLPELLATLEAVARARQDGQGGWRGVT